MGDYDSDVTVQNDFPKEKGRLIHLSRNQFPKLPIWARKEILVLDGSAETKLSHSAFSKLERESQSLARSLQILSPKGGGPLPEPRPGTAHDSAKLRVQPHPRALLQKHQPDPGHGGLVRGAPGTCDAWNLRGPPGYLNVVSEKL